MNKPFNDTLKEIFVDLSMTSEPIVLHIDGHQLAALCLNPDEAGEPVILLHGITSSIYAWPLQPPCVLVQGPCYSLSLPGHFPATFPADLPPEALTAEMIARLLSTAIRELVGDRPVTLIGHSTGGFAALAAAAYAPALARRVVSVSGFAQGHWTGALGLYQKLVRSGAPGRTVYKAIYKLAGLSPALLQAAMRIYVADARAFYAYPDLPDMMRNAYPAFKQLDLEAMIYYFGRMPEIDISDWLPRITATTLALTGDRDPIVPPTQAQQIAGLVKGAELAVIAGAGHLPFAERASEYNSVLSRWLAR
ncbi:MAG: alpha/beta hydrolase [Anaerolineae bacterium]|nr:alpha/beta hydrolase [Anaerolineae bacterium]